MPSECKDNYDWYLRADLLGARKGINCSEEVWTEILDNVSEGLSQVRFNIESITVSNEAPNTIYIAGVLRSGVEFVLDIIDWSDSNDTWIYVYSVSTWEFNEYSEISMNDSLPHGFLETLRTL